MTDLMTCMNPGFILIVAGILAAITPVSALRKVLVIGAPALAGFMVFSAMQNPEAAKCIISVGGIDLSLMRIDKLSAIWGYVFCLAGVLNGIYGLHEKCKITDSSALIYMGAAICAVFVGDLLSLFIFWELSAISSVMLVWKGGENAWPAGLRYLAMHVFSGVVLLAGAVMYGQSTGGDYSFNHIGTESPGGWLLLFAMGIKVGFPLLHNWMQDAYPKSSVTGTVILAAFTTKLAVYALARGFAGEDILIYIGAVMACFPVFFAVIENDLRRVLAYSLNNQLGYMVCGIGVGTSLAMNGVAGQMAAHVIFKGLLFMGMGAVLYRVGTTKASELGGLFRSMPITAVLTTIGAMTISAFPMLSAFVTKSMIMTAVLDSGHYVILAMLLFASAGVMEHSGIKVPYFTFFAHDSGKRVKEAPWNMLVAMGIAAFISIALAWPWGGYQFLYSILPFDAHYEPYTGNHVVTQLQLLFAAMFAFALLKRLGVYPAERRAEILDFDWFWRKPGKIVVGWIDAMWSRLSAHTGRLRAGFLDRTAKKFYNAFSPAGAMSAAAPSGLPAVLTGSMLVIVLAVIFIAGLR